jgi:hypothetical protein
MWTIFAALISTVGSLYASVAAVVIKKEWASRGRRGAIRQGLAWPGWMAAGGWTRLKRLLDKS